jgi:predicted AAA+ superfamily ATPase
MNEKLFKRQVVDEISRYLPTNDIIVLHGARQVGKTSIMYYLQNLLQEKGKTTFFIDLEDSRYVSVLIAGPQEFIKLLAEEGADPALFRKNRQKLYVFIDEIQYLAAPSSFLKLVGDHHREIKLIVSGSSSFEIKKKFTDSLAGRTVNFEIYPLSFVEFLTFNRYPFHPSGAYTPKKTEELKTLFEKFVLYGGYPKIALTSDKKMKEKYLQQIIDTYVKKDIRDLAEIKETHKFNRLLEALAAQSGQLLNVIELANTCNLAKQTVETYLFLLEQTYIIKLVRPFSKNLRSELSKTPKIFFYDSGLMQMLWLKELPKEILGPVFETGIFAELAKKYGVDKISYWRTIDKKEIDFILRTKSGILPIEVKINLINTRTAALRYFSEKYKTRQFKLVGLRGQAKHNLHAYPWEL